MVVLKELMNTYCFHDGYYDQLKRSISEFEKGTCIDLAGCNFTQPAFSAIRELVNDYIFINSANSELNEILRSMKDVKVGIPLEIPSFNNLDEIIEWVKSLNAPIYYVTPGYSTIEALAIILAVANRVDITFDISARYTEIAVFLEKNCREMLDNNVCYHTDGQCIYPDSNHPNIIGRIPAILGAVGVSLDNPEPDNQLLEIVVVAKMHFIGYNKLTENLRRELKECSTQT